MSEDKRVEHEDRELIQRMASKDADALDAFYTRYNRLAFSLVLRVVGNRADAEGADWRDVTRIVLHIDPEHESDRARRAFESHLSRARWMTEPRPNLV